MDVREVHAQGLPRAAFFLWNDDFEYTMRLLRHRSGRFVTERTGFRHRVRPAPGRGERPGRPFPDSSCRHAPTDRGKLAAMLIATHNVNGIRAAERRGFTGWRAARGCAVINME